MSPRVFIYGSLFFVSSLLLHVVIWRVRVPRHDALGLFLIFSVVPAVLLATLRAVNLAPVGGISVAHMLLLHAALSVFYISSYPAAQAISPSLDILLLIGSSANLRMTREEILANYDETVLVKARIDDLGRSALASRRGDTFRLTMAGRAVVRFFAIYRSMLGLPAGQG
ncbi:MAG: hypothetical protein M0Z79_01045 [Nitrospiraceae bacterium]|nr:hypothetical protein [Nitrospiraceae bacterium]